MVSWLQMRGWNTGLQKTQDEKSQGEQEVVFSYYGCPKSREILIYKVHVLLLSSETKSYAPLSFQTFISKSLFVTWALSGGDCGVWGVLMKLCREEKLV